MFGLSLIKTKDLKLLNENLKEKEMHYKNTWEAWKMADAHNQELKASIMEFQKEFIEIRKREKEKETNAR